MGTFVGPSQERVTFDDMADLLLNDYRITGKRSIQHAKRHVRTLRDTFGMVRAIDITPDRIAAYTADRLAAQRRPATVNRELAALRRMFTLAVRAGLLTHRPHVVMLDESDNARQGFLDPADFAAVAAHLPEDVADAATFAYLTAWRRGEVVTLEWRDVDLPGRAIRLRREHSKSKRGRVVALRGELLALLQRRQSLRRLDCPYVFHRDGRPLRYFRRSWITACQAAGVGPRLFHDLRRSAVRNMIRAGTTERVAMAISGHRTRSIFDRYDIVDENDLGAATERTLAYVAARRDEAPAVTPIQRSGRGPLGENTDKRRTIRRSGGRRAQLSY